ncbi:unnamed protein product [Rhizophagus irregularis]|nr:unnamed protein product [Rhizophagus irregularis]
MTVITFTYLIIPTGRFTGIPRNIAEGTITISNEEPVENLHTQIQQLLPESYKNVPFFLRALRPTLIEYRVMRQGIPISHHFSDSPTAEPHHVLIEEDAYHIHTL